MNYSFNYDKYYQEKSYNKAIREQRKKFSEFLKNPICLFDLTKENDSFRKKFTDTYTLEDVYYSIYEYKNIITNNNWNSKNYLKEYYDPGQHREVCMYEKGISPKKYSLLEEGRKLLLVKKPKGKDDKIEETNAVVIKQPTSIYDSAIKVGSDWGAISQITLYNDYFIVKKKLKVVEKQNAEAKDIRIVVREKYNLYIYI